MNAQPLINLAGFITGTIDHVLVPLVFAVAFLVFIYGVFQAFFSVGSDSEEKRKEGRKFIMYGIIGFFVMMSIWGIVNILLGTFGFSKQARPSLPSFGSPSQQQIPVNTLAQVHLPALRGASIARLD